MRYTNPNTNFSKHFIEIRKTLKFGVPINSITYFQGLYFQRVLHKIAKVYSGDYSIIHSWMSGKTDHFSFLLLPHERSYVYVKEHHVNRDFHIASSLNSQRIFSQKLCCLILTYSENFVDIGETGASWATGAKWGPAENKLKIFKKF